MYNLRRKYTSQRPILNHQTVIFTKSFNIDKSSWNNNAMAYLQKHQWGLMDLDFFSNLHFNAMNSRFIALTFLINC